MSETKTQIKPPVSVIESLSGGFEIAASHILAVLFPAALDLFLWLGPRLSINPLAQRFIALFKETPMPDATSIENQKLVIEMWQTIGERLNLFAMLSTWPVGVPSMMTAVLPQRMPTGDPTLLPLNSIGLLIILFGLFNILGLFSGAFYFNVLGSAFWAQPWTLSQFVQRGFVNSLKILGFVFCLLIIGVAFGLPFMLVVTLVQFVSPDVASLFIALGGTLAMWGWVFLGFTVPGMIIHRRSIWGAAWDSVRLVRANVPSVMGLYLLTLILNWGLGYLWGLPEPDSWLMLAAVGGHAFVSTALAAALFVFYQDRYRYWLEVRSSKTVIGGQ